MMASPKNPGSLGVTRVEIKLPRRPRLSNTAITNDRDLIGISHRLDLIVRHQDAGYAFDLQGLAHHLANTLPQPWIKGGERFVQQHEPGPTGQRPGQRDPLLLSARKLVRPPLRHGAVELHGIQHGLDTRLAIGPTLQAKGDVGGHVEVGKKSTVLCDDAHASQMRRKRALPTSWRLAAEDDHATVGLVKTGQQAQQRRLSRSGWADHSGAGMDRDHEVNAPQGGDGPEPLNETGDA